ncbi:MAG: HAD-IIA family hydrolase, partial [Chloroflexi bacterium]|nr:HAD-IIA family hydrolase [Chloroflexota bacterium]
MNQASVAAVILAAGASRRMGRPKQLLRWGPGQPTLLAHTLAEVQRAPFAQVIVVLGWQAERMLPEVEGVGVTTVVNPAWAEGLSSSLRAGLEAMDPQVQAALFVLADQPGLTADLLQRLVGAYTATGGPIVAPTLEGQPRPPVLFDRALFPALRALRGDQGGRSLLHSGQHRLVGVAVNEEWAVRDMDTPADYAAWGLQGHPQHHKDEAMQPNNRPLRNVQGFLLDLDGVFYWDEDPLPGGAEFMALLQRSGTPYLLLTNNATRTPRQYQQKLARMGISVSTDDVGTSALAAAAFLAEELPPGSRVFVVGQDGLVDALQAQGFVVTSTDTDVAAVVVGMDLGLTWEKLKRATLAIRRGALFIATNPDRTFPDREGIIPGNGAIVAALEAGSEQQALVIGKPETRIFDYALGRLSLPAAYTAMVGDRLNTDIEGAAKAGLPSVLVMCGLTSPEMLAASPVQPTVIC